MERMYCERPAVAMDFKIDCSKKGRPEKRWKEVIDVDGHQSMRIEKIRCRGSNALDTWLQKPA